MNAFVAQYQNNQVSLSTPEELLIMLFDGAIRFISHAKEEMEAGNTQVSGNFVRKAVAIVAELSDSLDHEVGHEFAADLDALYHFIMKNLSEANLHKDSAKLEVAGSLMRELRSTWQEAIDIAHGKDPGGLHAAATHPLEMLQKSLGAAV